MKRTIVLALALSAIALAACGGEDAATYSYEQVLDMTDLAVKDQPSGLPTVEDSLELPSGCGGLLLLGSDSVDLYVGAGDTVATNPGGTVGIKTTDDCVDELSTELEALP